MHSCAPIIRLCRHTLPTGRRCQQPAVGGRSRCRHHLDAQARLHNMARARRLTVIPRLRVPETDRDLDWNQLEINRVLATERIDPDVALMMLWAMDLSAAALRSESPRRRRAQNHATKPNGIYDVPLNPLFPQSLIKNLSQPIENTESQREGGTPILPAVPPRSLPAAPNGLNRAERRRLAAMRASEERKAKSDQRTAPVARHL
jgi:hypothetical protein